MKCRKKKQLKKLKINRTKIFLLGKTRNAKEKT